MVEPAKATPLTPSPWSPLLLTRKMHPNIMPMWPTTMRPAFMVDGYIQISAKRLVRGCEKFVVALAYVFCLPLPGSCLARFAYLLADLCTLIVGFHYFFGLSLLLLCGATFPQFQCFICLWFWFRSETVQWLSQLLDIRLKETDKLGSIAKRASPRATLFISTPWLQASIST